MIYDTKACGERIRQLRIASGLTQEKMAAALNVDRSFYSRVESGKNGCSVELLIQLSRLFKVSLDYIVLGEKSDAVPTPEYSVPLKLEVTKLIEHLEDFKLRL